MDPGDRACVLGLLLCSGRGSAEVEYATAGTDQQSVSVGASDGPDESAR